MMHTPRPVQAAQQILLGGSYPLSHGRSLSQPVPYFTAESREVLLYVAVKVHHFPQMIIREQMYRPKMKTDGEAYFGTWLRIAVHLKRSIVDSAKYSPGSASYRIPFPDNIHAGVGYDHLALSPLARQFVRLCQKYHKSSVRYFSSSPEAADIRPQRPAWCEFSRSVRPGRYRVI
ncbi:hypothetical protein D3C73_1054840 [compost metagenome]